MGEFAKIYVVTMWSGGRPSKKWKTLRRPELLPQGNGVEFTSADTRLEVQVIGNLSIEEYEQGMPIPEWPGDATEAPPHSIEWRLGRPDQQPNPEDLL